MNPGMLGSLWEVNQPLCLMGSGRGESQRWADDSPGPQLSLSWKEGAEHAVNSTSDTGRKEGEEGGGRRESGKVSCAAPHPVGLPHLCLALLLPGQTQSSLGLSLRVQGPGGQKPGGSGPDAQEMLEQTSLIYTWLLPCCLPIRLGDPKGLALSRA